MELDEFTHKRFVYVYIPQDPDEPVKELEFEGKEGKFRERIRNHFQKNVVKNKTGLASSIAEQSKGATAAQVQSAVDFAHHSYQIVPLTLPMKTTNYIGINAYVDDVGQFKDYKLNIRATRVLSSETKGDCFISKTFDDEDQFERRDFTLAEFDGFLKNPPNPKGRWDPSMAFPQNANPLQSLMAQADALKIAEEKMKDTTKCNSCSKTAGDVGKSVLSRCGTCKQASYCSADCQKADWSSHKKVCKKVVA